MKVIWFQPWCKCYLEIFFQTKPNKKPFQKNLKTLHSFAMTAHKNKSWFDYSLIIHILPQQGTAFVLQRTKTWQNFHKGWQHELLTFSEKCQSVQLLMEAEAPPWKNKTKQKPNISVACNNAVSSKLFRCCWNYLLDFKISTDQKLWLQGCHTFTLASEAPKGYTTTHVQP